MPKYIYNPWKHSVTNYEQLNTTSMDQRFFGATQPAMQQRGQVVILRYAEGVNLLGRVQTTDKLYVLGHCEPGAQYIESGIGGEQLSAKDVADRLEENGLVDRNMSIKLYACSGGRGTLFKSSFASRLLKELRKKKYQLISVQAYTRTVTQKSNVDGRGFHKWAMNDKDRIVGRASQFRRTFR